MVSSLGNVKSIPRLTWNGKNYYLRPEKIMKQHFSSKGYKMVCLTARGKEDKSIPVHRLVAKAFINNPKGYSQVNHKDGDKTNNNVNNLEWCDNSYNQIHAYKNGLNHTSIYAGRFNTPCIAKNLETGEIIYRYISLSEAKRELECSQSAIRKAVMGLNKTYPYHMYRGLYWDIDYERLNELKEGENTCRKH